MQSVSPEFLVTSISMLINIFMAFVMAKVKLEISELKTLLYKEFVTKEHFEKFTNKNP